MAVSAGMAISTPTRLPGTPQSAYGPPHHAGIPIHHDRITIPSRAAPPAGLTGEGGGYACSSRGEEHGMAHVAEEVRVDRPVSEVYNQWTQFEEFPQFMSGIEQVQQQDDTHLHWKANIAGQTAEWDAEITEQVPDQVIAWRAVDGAQNQGRVQFQQEDGGTRVRLELDVEPQGIVQQATDMMGMLEGQVREDLNRFKQLIESRGEASGEWRGEVRGGETQ
jgi:uncharacterized membrane protein